MIEIVAKYHFMEIKSFPFQTLNWDTIEKEAHKGITGTAWWQVFEMGAIRIRRGCLKSIF